MSPKLFKINLWELSFKKVFQKEYQGCQKILKSLAYSWTYAQRERHQKDMTETQRCPFPQTSLSHSTMHTKIHCSSAEWVRGMELKLCYDHLCSRGGFLHQERAQTRWEQSHTKWGEEKKTPKCPKKKNSAKKKRNNKKEDGERKITWIWVSELKN